MNDQSSTPAYNQEPLDIESVHADALRTASPARNDRWIITARIAILIQRMVPGSRVTTGHPRGPSDRTDYITLTPNSPLTVFGPDGRFIVSFLKDGTWIDANGRVSSPAGFLEGGPHSIAELIIREAGFTPPSGGWQPRGRIRPNYDDGLRRSLQPTPTHTWRDVVKLPSGQTWDENTPPSICRESVASRLLLASYDPNSCTFTTSMHPRWGVESLRIPAIKADPVTDRDYLQIEQVRAGDCLFTMGPKFPASGESEGEADHDEDLEGNLVWHPQRVIRVEPEGRDHLRVWLARDNDVANQTAHPDDLDVLHRPENYETKVLYGEDVTWLQHYFHLEVFCQECGNRGTPIVYGMPASDDPSHIALGGCVIQSDLPTYACSCGNRWGTLDFIEEEDEQ